MGNITIKDVAKESGVSTASISRVLNESGYVSNETKARVLAAVKKLNYQPNAIARSLKQDKTNTIGVVVPDIANPYFMKIAKAIEDTVSNSGYNLIFCSFDEDSEKERELLTVMYEKRVDAIVLATSGESEDIVASAGIPIVLLDRKMEIESQQLDYVIEDNIQAAYGLTKTLLEQGHRQIGVVNGSLKVSTGWERYEGYKQAMQEYRLKEDLQFAYQGNFAQQDGCLAVDYFLSLDKKPTAILSFNNTMSFGVILELRRRGYNIPEDMVVASYGEVEAAQLLDNPQIIYVKQEPYEMGLKVGKIIMHRLQKRKKIIQETFIPQIHLYGSR
ncbi:LacI family DNA-binding transcriptional regulator [Desmospora activa]|uniref:LacI family transcriptional regulator n=1 Tax=Desmospora activa DSM 45169 TaxID=1121389 RepID=A0A2T4ZD38_9BACL|nr:LacI family DNA-binding transcriptional regulator [Desmospora activa]PTM59803.1 LacI family transcriptional regulator [Desmospora activa DSM 45169]